MATPDERRLAAAAKHFGVVRDDSADGGQAAFNALLIGGGSGFDGMFGGNREADGQICEARGARILLDGLRKRSSRRLAYNFGKNGQILIRHSGGNKRTAISVRCVKDG